MSTPEPHPTEASGIGRGRDADGPVFLTKPQHLLDLMSEALLKPHWGRAEGRPVTTPGTGRGDGPRSGAAIVLTTAADVTRRDALLQRVQADLERRKARASA